MAGGLQPRRAGNAGGPSAVLLLLGRDPRGEQGPLPPLGLLGPPGVPESTPHVLHAQRATLQRMGSFSLVPSQTPTSRASVGWSAATSPLLLQAILSGERDVLHYLPWHGTVPAPSDGRDGFRGVSHSQMHVRAPRSRGAPDRRGPRCPGALSHRERTAGVLGLAVYERRVLALRDLSGPSFSSLGICLPALP